MTAAEQLELERKPDKRPHTWPCSCPYCAAMVIADDGPDERDDYLKEN